VQRTEDDLQAKWNHPQWWIRKLQKQYPEHWQYILQANNQAAPMTWRVNTARIARDALQARWAEAGIDAVSVGEHGLTLTQPRPVKEIPGFSEGLCSVQDAAAQCAAQLLLERVTVMAPNKLRVLDACAAPGGKTAHLLELLGDKGNVVALDIDAQRSDRIHQNLQRLGLRAEVIAADAGQPDQWWDGQMFDVILLDAPCTASGIVRRHPDVRWLRRESDVAQLAGIQKSLLQKLWPLLRPEGRLLYCTCSVFHEEGQHQVQAFVQHNTEAEICPSLGHLRPQNLQMDASLSDNLQGDHDGFYYALLRKRATP
jgi:16S rRNA (cytosine967-C5)-methyltransferase